MKQMILNLVSRFVSAYILKEYHWVKTLEFHNCIVEEKDTNSGRYRWRINKSDTWKKGKHPMRETNKMIKDQ